MPLRSTSAATPSRQLDHPEPADIRLEEVLHACADPMRLRIIQALAADAAAACGEIGLACSKSTATYHFRVLREAGVITQRYQGTAKVNELRRADLDAVFPGLLDALLASATAQSGRTREA
ncbi:helix-turn-helix transcriptional regulator [Streptomyces sp. SL13]|jgi:DNA-binding transcriptional ArsR family regulator|uniref:Helix-turn-helix transcriptional regulator n=1 Tax=Streptantibioticus silvisoli TaxID=2705255 RepID=A0AA90KG80_9ACTN|nr:helix-turn-helix transcriptional regulator [Streptantibioticus silvisoli]MDI5969824.1 helix-turn-helix transcriptional regulator [Streptantibioticus silvisoli]